MTAPTELRWDGKQVSLDRLVASRLLIQANSGGGKSRALRALLEQTHGRVQHLVLDSEGEFGTLREKFDYLLAGEEGDIPASPKTARLLCRRAMELGASTICNLYGLPLPQRREFVRLFLLELMALPRALWRATLVVIDEAHTFAPERGAGEASSTEAVIALCSQGRKRGFMAALATQRISKLHKDAAAELLNKLVGRTGLDVDVKRAGDELGFGKEERQALKTLAPGTFFAYGPAISDQVTLVRTSAVVTSHPEIGKVAAPVPPPPAAVRRVLEQLKDLPKEAEAEAQTVEELRRQVRRLEGDLRVAKKGAPTAPDPDHVARLTAAAEERGRKAVLRDWQQRERNLKARLAGIAWDTASSLSISFEQLALGTIAASAPDAPTSTRPRAATAAPALASAIVGREPDRKISPSIRRESAAEGVVSDPQQRILNALAWLESIGRNAVDKVLLAIMAGASPKSSGYANNLGALRSAGRIDYPGPGQVALTESGRALAAAVDVPTTNEALQASLFARLKAPQVAILRPLIEAAPEAIGRMELAERAGQSATSSGYANNLGSLRSLGLLDYPRTGEVVATAALFIDPPR